jgi:hypothetical protein
MSKVALYVPLEAKPGRENEVAEFLRSALPLVANRAPLHGLPFKKAHRHSRFSIPLTTRPDATRISMARSPQR